MSICLYGSQKKQSAPSSFTVDTGALCFLLGIDSVICPILDKIPALVGKPWKEIIEKVAKEGLGLAIDLVTGQIDTSTFCSVDPPVLSSDISYADVFQFIASYVPPFSLIASSDPLLNKITKLYLYTKWFVYCECKKIDFPPQGSNEPTPPFVPSCPNSSAISSQINALIDSVNTRNDQGSIQYPQFTQLTSGGFYQNITQSQYDMGLSFLQNGDSNHEILSFNEYTSGCNTSPNQSTIGCLKVTGIGDDVPSRLESQAHVRNTDTGEEFSTSVIRYDYCRKSLTWDESDCCPPFVPPPPSTHVPPPPSNCVPTPPPRYCELYPNDPLCSNVPPCPPCPPPSVECVSTTITVEDYICGTGEITKDIEWKL